MTNSLAQPIAWPDPACVAHVYHGQGRDRPRFTRHKTEGWEYPGVTTILKPWDKEGLVKWAADLERAACLEAAADVYQVCLDKGYRLENFAVAMEAKLGSARQHQRKKEAAGDIGTAAHERIRWHINHELGIETPMPLIPDESELAVMAWQDHWKATGITPLRAEQPIWSHNHQVAGTVDLFALRDGQLGIVDLKTSKGIYPSMHYQVAEYCALAEECLGVEVEWAELWRVPKSLEDLSFEVVPLGTMRVWNGQGFDMKQRTREQLIGAFLGIRTAWEVQMNPLAP